MAGGLGFCALDRRRDPLVGDEIRGCWEAALVAAPREAGDAPWMPAGFVEMDEALPPGAAGPGPGEPRWSLWGDPEA